MLVKKKKSEAPLFKPQPHTTSWRPGGGGGAPGAAIENARYRRQQDAAPVEGQRLVEVGETEDLRQAEIGTGDGLCAFPAGSGAGYGSKALPAAPRERR